MESVRIVRARPDDALLVAALLLQMMRAKGDEPGPDFLERAAASWRERRRELPSWIAQHGGAHAGLVQLARIPAPLGRGASAWLLPPFVRPDHRGGGVGPALIHAATEWAKGAGVRLLLAEPDAADEQVCRDLGYTMIAPGLALRRFDVSHGHR